jgi:hypothetical protein
MSCSYNMCGVVFTTSEFILFLRYLIEHEYIILSYELNSIIWEDDFLNIKDSINEYINIINTSIFNISYGKCSPLKAFSLDSSVTNEEDYSIQAIYIPGNQDNGYIGIGYIINSIFEDEDRNEYDVNYLLQILPRMNMILYTLFSKPVKLFSIPILE